MQTAQRLKPVSKKSTSAWRVWRRVLRGTARSFCATASVTGEVALWTVVRLARVLAWALGRCARWAWRHPRTAASSAAAVAAVTLVLVFLVPARDAGVDLGESLECMARNIYHEARGEPVLAQIAVGKVVMNRVSHRRFPGTVCAVVKQGGEWPHNKCQFSWWCDGKSDETADWRAMAKIREIARDVLNGRHDDPTGGAMWYHATRVRPAWRLHFEKGPMIGDHIFYRLGSRS